MRAVLVKWLIRKADIAHLVERNLAKVEVASSSLVVRSNFFDGTVGSDRQVLKDL